MGGAYIGRGECRHSHSPDTERRPENTSYERQSRQERGWWRTGTDKLASYGLETEVWISENSTISDSNPIYWAGTESGLMEIYNFPEAIYATDGSKGNTGMGAGVYRHDTKGGGCWERMKSNNWRVL